MVYLIARAAPRVNDVSNDDDIIPHAKIDKMLAKIPMEKIDILFSISVEKALRKIKLLLMKWDNVVTAHIKKIKHANGSVNNLESRQTLFEEMQEAQEEKSEDK